MMRAFLCILLGFGFISFGFSQGNKKIIFADADSTYFRLWQEYIIKHDLMDMAEAQDSLFIRFTESNIQSNNKIIYEFKKTGKGWKSRIIGIGKPEYYYFGLEYVLFNKYHLYTSKKTKKLDYKKQIKIDPSDFFESLTYDSIKSETIPQKLMQLKSKSEIDTSVNKVEVDTSDYLYNLEIEISTTNEYKYIYWSNTYPSSDTYDSNIIKKLEGALLDVFFTSRNKYQFKNYHKNRWPKH